MENKYLIVYAFLSSALDGSFSLVLFSDWLILMESISVIH